MEYMVYVEALGNGFPGVKDALYRQHLCNDSYAMLSLSKLPMCSLVHMLVFGAVSIVTVPMSAAVRNHNARVRITAEKCFDGSAFEPRGKVSHTAANSDMRPFTSWAPILVSSLCERFSTSYPSYVKRLEATA